MVEFDNTILWGLNITQKMSASLAHHRHVLLTISAHCFANAKRIHHWSSP